MKVPHADLILEYAKDCQIEGNVEPWKGWEEQAPPDTSGSLWACYYRCPSHPQWISGYKYRRKPRTITINGFEVPEPLREAPEEGVMLRYCRARILICILQETRTP